VLAVCHALDRKGVSQEKPKQAHASIGIDIGVITPEEIAISIVAELTADRRRCTANFPHLRNMSELMHEETV
jgi:xanthine/CO dehydrogenase XdhC/CoxF family maturation factor